MKKETIEHLYETGLITDEEHDSLLRKFNYTATSQSTLSILTLISAIFSLIIITSFKVNYTTVVLINNEEIRNWVSAFFALFSVCSFYYAKKNVEDSESITFAYTGIGMSAPLVIMFVFFLLAQIFQTH